MIPTIYFRYRNFVKYWYDSTLEYDGFFAIPNFYLGQHRCYQANPQNLAEGYLTAYQCSYGQTDTKYTLACVALCETEDSYQQRMISKHTRNVIYNGEDNETSYSWATKRGLYVCPLMHVTHDFLACDSKVACLATKKGDCVLSLRPNPPMMPCRSGSGSVSYTLVCDHKIDCLDGSDEEFCTFPRCSMGYTSCGDGQVSTFLFDPWFSFLMTVIVPAIIYYSISLYFKTLRQQSDKKSSWLNLKCFVLNGW